MISTYYLRSRVTKMIKFWNHINGLKIISSSYIVFMKYLALYEVKYLNYITQIANIPMHHLRIAQFPSAWHTHPHPQPLTSLYRHSVHYPPICVYLCTI